MHPLRTRFKKEIVTEFLPPAVWFKKHAPKPRRAYTDDKAKIIIFASGMPGVPSKRHVVEFLSKKGFWVFYPRYRGSWESGGKFLRISPERDILDIIDSLPRGFKDLWSETTYKVKPAKLYLIGGSFGGPAVILASRDKRVTKAVASTPVVDWNSDSKAEPLAKLEKFVREGFGGAYRFSKSDWAKLAKGKFYSPVAHAKEIDGKKLLIIHVQDDDIVLPGPVRKFARCVGAEFWSLKKGGHGAVDITKPRFYKKIMKFLRA